MALPNVSASARNARVVLLVLRAGALVGLCFPHVLPPVTERYSHISFKAVDPSRDVKSGTSKRGFHNASPSSITSTDHRNTGSNLSVRTVGLKHVDDGGGGSENQQKLNSFKCDADAVASWRDSTNARSRTAKSGDSEADVHRIGKRMIITRRGRSLRTSKPYPCSLPAGSCQQKENCCGSACANAATDPNHCGRCGHICRSDRACCSGKCRRLATDEHNCGRCGSRCALGTKCQFGLCGY